MQPLKRAGSFLGPALLALSALVLLAIGAGPRTGAYRTLTILSGSMGETAPAGSMVVATPVPASEVAVGDVITFSIPVEDHRVVTHRVVEVVEAGDRPVVRTKGDASEAMDPWAARLEGGTAWKTRFAIPGLGRVVGILRHPALSVILLRVVPTLLALLWLAAIWGRPSPDAAPAAERTPA